MKFSIIGDLPSASDLLFHLVVIDEVPESPLAAFSRIEEARALIEAGADIDAVNHTSRMSLLCYALDRRDLGVAFLLIENGARIDPEKGCIHPANVAARKFPEAIDMLLEAGMDLTGIDEDSGLPVWESIGEVAKKAGNHEVARKLEVAARPPVAPGFASPDDDINRYVIGDWVRLKREFSRERNETRKHYLGMLYESGPTRIFSPAPDSAALSGLHSKFPNFSQAITYIEKQVRLFDISSRKSLVMQPLLLSGSPGIGKTRFISEVAKILNLEFSLVGCGTVTAGWVIGGSSTSWNEGKPGMVHVAMRDGKTANPLVMLDELDKLAGDSRFDPFGPLYQLLEKFTAKTFADEAVSIPIDCSQINWIATANDVSTIPKPIMSRFTVIEVDAPTKSQMMTVAKSIYDDILKENILTWGSRFSRELDDNVIKSIAEMTPREIRLTLMDAIGNAVVSRDADIFHITMEDILLVPAKTSTRRPGFV